MKYLFLANDGVTESTGLHVEPFNASQEQNDYEVRNSSGLSYKDSRVAFCVTDSLVITRYYRRPTCFTLLFTRYRRVKGCVP